MQDAGGSRARLPQRCGLGRRVSRGQESGGTHLTKDMQLPRVWPTRRTLMIAVAIIGVNLAGDFLAIAAWPHPVGDYSTHSITYEFISDGSIESRYNHDPWGHRTLARPASTWSLLLVWCPIAVGAWITLLAPRATRANRAGREGPASWLRRVRFTLGHMMIGVAIVAFLLAGNAVGIADLQRRYGA